MIGDCLGPFFKDYEHVNRKYKFMILGDFAKKKSLRCNSITYRFVFREITHGYGLK